MAIYSVRHSADTNTNTNADANTDTNSDANADTDTDTNSKTNTNADTNADTSADANAFSDYRCRGCSLCVSSASESRQLGERLGSKCSGRRSYSPYRCGRAESHYTFCQSTALL